MAQYDLTPRIPPHLDRHLVFPLLEFLQERQLYADEEILKSKIELLSKTNMVDYAMDIHKSLYHTDEVPQDMVERRMEVVARLKALEEAAAPLVAFLQNPNAVQELRADKHYNLQMLNDRYQVFLNDPFLGKRVEESSFSTVPLRDEFLENARLFIFETYCKIHRRIDMGKLSSRARWDNEIAMAEVLERNDHMWTITGVVRSGKLFYTLEETLFLMELGALLLIGENGAGLSLQDIYVKLAEEKSGCSWELYEVYKHLKSFGYIVGRHDVPSTLKSVKNDVPMEDKFITDKFNKLGLNEIRPAFNVYPPNGIFTMSFPGDPTYVICLTRESPPLRTEVEVLERQCGHIPVKFCHIEKGRVSFFSFSKVDLLVLP